MKWFCRGENGELRVGVRRLSRQQSTMPSSVISSHSMHLGVLATASHAAATLTRFVVYYKPRLLILYFCSMYFVMSIWILMSCVYFDLLSFDSRASQFLVSLSKYKEAMNTKFLVGMRFKMRFEGEDSPERR